MTLAEILKVNGISDEVAKAVIDKMKEEKIYTTSLENADTRYTKLKEQKDAVDAELATANQTITDLKKASKGQEELQAKIKEHETTISNLKTEAQRTARTHTLKDAMKDKGVVDPDYLIYKHGGVDKFTFGEDGTLTGLDDVLKPYRESMPSQFKPGYNPNVGGGGNITNPFAKETYNLTEQGKLFRENPEQARALAKAAGVTIGF